MSKGRILQIGVFALLVTSGVVGRLIPHPWNFTPVVAAALFAGYYFRHWWVALLVPLLTRWTTDFVVPYVASAITDSPLRPYEGIVMVADYVAMCFPVIWGPLLRSPLPAWALKRNWLRLGFPGLRIAGCAASGSMVFFVLSNFAVWLAGWYPQTLGGLVSCYVAGLPFFHHTLAGDLFYSGVFFGAYAVVTSLARLPSSPPLEEPVTRLLH